MSSMVVIIIISDLWLFDYVVIASVVVVVVSVIIIIIIRTACLWWLCYLWVHNNVDSWSRLLLLFLLWWIVVWHCNYSLQVKLWLSKLTSRLMMYKRLTEAMIIISLVPCISISSSSVCRLVIIISNYYFSHIVGLL